MNQLRRLVDQGIAQFGLRGFAREAGIDIGTLRSVKDGRDIKVSNLIDISQALGMQLSFAPAKTAPGFEESPKQDRPITLSADGGQEALRAGFMPLPWHPECGRGVAPVAFARAWLAEHHLHIETLNVVRPDQCYLSVPSAPSGVLVVAETGAILDATPHPWIVRIEQQFILARVHRQDTTLVLVSGDNPAHPPQAFFHTNLRLIGRAVWIGSGISQN